MSVLSEDTIDIDVADADASSSIRSNSLSNSVLASFAFEAILLLMFVCLVPTNFKKK